MGDLLFADWIAARVPGADARSRNARERATLVIEHVQAGVTTAGGLAEATRTPYRTAARWWAQARDALGDDPVRWVAEHFRPFDARGRAGYTVLGSLVVGVEDV